MKVTVVPAQVTTVEDRIVGSLGLSQLLLLSLPIFGGSLLYIVLPPVLHTSLYKIAVMVAFALVCGLLSIRVKGKILLFWLVVILRYNLRPRYYVFNKRSVHGRDMPGPVKEEVKEEIGTVRAEPKRHLPLSVAELAQLQTLIDNPAANLSFETKKGYLYVRITEVK